MLQLVEPVYRRIGKRVQQLREERGWTQKELAKKVDLSRQSITNLETGKQRVRLHEMAKFHKAFSLSPEDFFSGTL